MGVAHRGKRELILEAAEKIFSEKGFFQAKVEEIAVEAGVGKGTVYEYFSSKDEVFEQMLWEVLQDSELNGVQMGDTSTCADWIQAILNQHHRFVVKHKNMAKMLMHEHMTMSKDMFQAIKASKEEKLRILEDIVVKGMATGELRADIKPKMTARLIMGATASVSGDILEGDNCMSAEELTTWVCDMIFRGIGAGPNATKA